MITNLSQDFIDAVNSKSRKPVQLIEFILPNEIFYLSDIAIGKGQGLSNDYNPWVESWGTLKDNTNLSALFEGNSLEIRSGTIIILVSPTSRTFVKKLFQVGVENTVVKLYQWFSGLASDPVLIDIMVCQDPIKHSEASMLLQIDLVSTLMKTDPYLWPEEPGVEAQPIVVGKATGMPLKNLQTSRVTTLEQDISFDETLPITVFVGNGVGFPVNGIVSIDSEDFVYDWISASAIHITTRAQNGTTARPHLRGALISPYGAIYDYAICSGPVQTVDNLLGNSEPYVNSAEFFPGQNPVIARFVGRPPWLKVSPGYSPGDIIPDPVTDEIQYGTRTEQYYGNGASEPTNDAAINAAAGAATLVINQQTGGGSGFINNRSSPYLASYNLGGKYVASAIYANLSDTNPNMGSSPYVDTNNGIQGHIDHLYHWDDSVYGYPSKVVVKVGYNTPTYCNYNSIAKVEVFFVDHTGSEWLLDSEQAGPSVSANFTHLTGTKSYDVSSRVNTFAQLALCRLRVRINIIVHNTSTYNAINFRWLKTYWDVNYSPNPGGILPSPYQRLLTQFGRDISEKGTLINVKARVRFSAVINNADVYFIIYNYSISNPLWSTTTTSNFVKDSVFDLGVMSWGDLNSLRIGVSHQIIGPNTENITRYSNVSFSYVQFLLTYQPNTISTPDEERVVYAETLTVDVTSILGSDPTPPQVVRQLIEDHSGASAYIDDADFNSAHSEYDSANYYLNGVLPAQTKLHDALKQVLMEGMCRLLFNQGVIKLISYFEEQDLALDFDIDMDDVQLRSRKTDNQPTSIIKNDITVMYDKDYDLEVYDGKIHIENPESIALFFRKDYRRELKLVDSEAVAQLHADRLLAIRSTPTSVYSFQMFLKAYILEKGDRIAIRTFLDSRFTSTGNVLSIERIFGKGKAQQINLFKISIANPVSTAHLELLDTIIVDDSSVSLLKGLILRDSIIINDNDVTYIKVFNIPNERLQIKDDFYSELCQVDGYGTCGYGLHGYGE